MLDQSNKNHIPNLEYKSKNNREKLKREKEKALINQGFNLAERTGLEPATPGVTGRYSNQLNYRS